MREKVGALYWAITGAMMGFGLVGLMSIGGPFLITGTAMIAFGVWKPGIGKSWAFLIGFGGLPALVFSLHIIEAVQTALNPYCDQGSWHWDLPSAGPIECAIVPISYYVLFGISIATMFAGMILRLLLRTRPRTV